jgi:hypothetical protein
VDLAAGDRGQEGIEEGRQAPQQAALRLAPQPQQDHVVAREDGVHHPRHDRLVVAEDPRKQLLAAAQLGEQVSAHLVLDAGLGRAPDLFNSPSVRG